jgi:hypothetical protein
MKLLFSILSMTFLFSVGALALGSIASLGAMFFGYPIGWSIATAITCLAFAGSGWKGLTNLGLGEKGISNNAEAAFGLLHISALVAVALFAISEMPNQLSAWWALLIPLLIVPSFFLQWLLEIVLNFINQNGKRA